MLSFYHSIAGRQASFISKAEAYKLFTSDKYKEATEYIQKTFASGLSTNFSTSDKSEYQEAKRKLLPGVCFSGNIDRNADQEDFIHSGLLTLDIDENSKEDLQRFWCLVNEGKLVHIEAAGRSVSGAITGALWVNIRIEVPSGKFPAKLAKALKLNGKESSFERLSALQAAYWSAFSYLLKKEANITTGKAGKDLKRLRYVSFDPELYLNDKAECFSIETLLYNLQQQEADKSNDLDSFASLDIEQTEDAFQYAERFAAAKGLTFKVGSKHSYRNALAIALNLLGVQRQEAEAFILAKYRPSSGHLTNEVSFPYRNYKESFGAWSSRLTPCDVKAEKTFTLSPGQRISDYSDQLAELILAHKKIDLEAGTGTGKNYAFVKHVAPKLKALTGLKTVIVVSLNAKADKDAGQYNVPYLTGQRLLEAGQAKGEVWKQALEADVLLCNQNAFEGLAKRLERRFEKRHIVIDESHTLLADYKQKVTSALWLKLPDVAETVTLLSGTPKPYFAALGYTRIAFKQLQRSSINTTVRQYTGSAEDVVLKHIKDTDFRKKRLVIKLQSKKGINTLKGVLQASGFHPEELVTLVSETSVKQSAAYKSFLKATPDQSSFADRVKVILCTSFVNEGLDFYSAFELEFINVEKSSVFSPDDLVQFADRWRTDKDKTLVSYHKASDFRQTEFNALYNFSRALEFFEAEAARLNALQQQFAGVYSLQKMYSTKTSFSIYEGFLAPGNEGTLAPDVLKIAAEIAKDANSHTGTLEGWKQITAKHKYFKVTFEGSFEVPEVDKKAFTQAQKSERQEAEKKLVELFDQDKETLLQAVGLCTEDLEIKKATSFKASRREAVQSLKDRLPSLFTDRLEDAERLAKAFYKFTSVGFSEDAFRSFFFDSDKFTSRQKLTVFLTSFRLNLLFTVFNLSKAIHKMKGSLPVLTVQQVQDAKRLEAFCLGIEAVAYKGSVTVQDAFRVLKSSHAGLTALTERKAVSLLQALFLIEEQRTRSGIMYKVHKRQTIEDFLLVSLGASATKQYIENLHNELKNNELGCTFMQVFLL